MRAVGVVAGLLVASSGSQAALPALDGNPITPIPRPPDRLTPLQTLGGALFADPRLSGQATRSCASCHDLATNGASRVGAPGDGGSRPGHDPTLTVFNATLKWRLDWAGDVRTLEEQADRSLRDPDVMDATPAVVIDRLRHDPDTRGRFTLATGRAPDWPGLIAAIAAFERTLLTPDSRFDRWLAGDRGALTDREQQGYRLFRSIGCAACHQGVAVGANLFERQGVVDPTHVPSHQMFLVPSLRNVAVMAPYFHDGSAATLDVAVRRMAQAQLGRTLPASDIDLIVAFLGTLTGAYRGHALTEPR